MGIFDFLRDIFGSPLKPEPRGSDASRAKAVSPEIEQLAATLGTTGRDLLWLADRWGVATRQNCHYVAFRIPKRTGGHRTILAPKKRLKAVQREIYRRFLAPQSVAPASHGFVKGRSILSNARPHIGAPLLVKADLVDFFHSIGYPRVRGLFKRLGHPPEVASLLAALTTAPVRATVEGSKGRLAAEYFRSGQRGAASSRRVTVQGAPTSPAIANLVCRRLDKRLTGLAAQFKASYTRYADDMTFSGGPEFELALSRFLPRLAEIIRAEGFRLSKRKFVVARKGDRHVVTGLVTNQKASVDRRAYKRLKAILHNCSARGAKSQSQGIPLPEFRKQLEGIISFVRWVDPKKGDRLLSVFRRMMWA
jgi:retron-type reverse transcriptase